MQYDLATFQSSVMPTKTADVMGTAMLAHGSLLHGYFQQAPSGSCVRPDTGHS